MKILYRKIANTIFFIHLFLVLFILFGGFLPNLWYLYIPIVVIALLSEVMLGYCFLSKWEYGLWKKIDPTINYDYTFTTHYTYKLTGKKLPASFYSKAATIFMIFSIGISLFFKLLYQNLV